MNSLVPHVCIGFFHLIFSDLLQVPRDQIVRCLEQVKSLEKTRYVRVIFIQSSLQQREDFEQLIVLLVTLF